MLFPKRTENSEDRIVLHLEELGNTEEQGLMEWCVLVFK